MIRISEVDGQISLDHCHAYYYQVQTQIFVCDIEYCNFCVCIFSGDEESTTHIERIYRNNKFWKDHCVPKAKAFLRLAYCLNYWVVGTHAPSCHPLSLITVLIRKPSIQLRHSQCSQSGGAVQPSSQTFCYCNGPEIDEMIALYH